MQAPPHTPTNKSRSATQVSPVKRTNTGSTVYLHRMPQELLLTILVDVLEREGDIKSINTFALVCQHWADLMKHDFVWTFVAKHYFVAFPLIRNLLSSPVPAEEDPPLHMSPSPLFLGASHDRATPLPTSSSTATAAAAAGETKVVHRRSFSLPDVSKPTKRSVKNTTLALRAYLDQQQHAHRIAQRRRYVLHVFLSFTLLFVATSMTCFTCAFEKVGPSEAFENGINFGWATVVLVVATIIANLIMQAHFEPRPLAQRIAHHFQLIAKTVLVLVLGVVVLVLPAAMLHHNAYAANEALKYSPRTVVLPIALASMAWQAQVAFRFRDRLAAIFSGQATISPRGVYEACANLTPLFCLVTCACAVVYMEQSAAHHGALIAGSIIPFITCIVLGVLFLFDFLTGANPLDGIASLSLFVASACPLLLMVGVVRGLTLLPLAVAASLFFVGHARQLVKLLRSVDELDVLVESGQHHHNE